MKVQHADGSGRKSGPSAAAQGKADVALCGSVSVDQQAETAPTRNRIDILHPRRVELEAETDGVLVALRNELGPDRE
ncbi:MAG: hypothetical protein H7A46_16900 [Verrucomicrobiales bacterium]|nr:hypothetical protein [Verrucomicrobiales bacterium]